MNKGYTRHLLGESIIEETLITWRRNPRDGKLPNIKEAINGISSLTQKYWESAGTNDIWLFKYGTYTASLTTKSLDDLGNVKLMVSNDMDSDRELSDAECKKLTKELVSELKKRGAKVTLNDLC